ncbi:MAG: 4-alpha-glucanotransferase [Verrucomicrobiae bacterium]|nr:4-alpha-glucanotransferase [Verrucomicrobiae bacterium]
MSDSDTATGTPNPAARSAGILIPVFSIRTEDDLGIGDVGGLRQFVDWAAGAGWGFVQLLPVNETGPDNSPYNSISSVALEPLTIDCSPTALPELSEADYWRLLGEHGIDRLRRGNVQYEAIRGLKQALLWEAFSGFLKTQYRQGTKDDEAFHAFCEDEADWLGDYCLFRLLMDMEGGSHVWQNWGEDFNTIEKARTYVDGLLEVEAEKTERQLVYYAWVQWTAFSQWRSVREYADSKGVCLMGDIPYGISACSVDVFANPDIFDLDWYGGAPPEKLFKDDPFVQKWGQNWGIPLYRWDVLKERDYDWWRQRVGKVTEMFSMFRIDHALGFYRIYSFPWNPVRNDEFFPLSEDEAADRCEGRRPGFRPHPDDSDENKAANRESGEVIYRVLIDAAGEAVIIAEDLGVVPDYVSPSLTSLGIPGMAVPQWNFDGDQIRKGENYPELSFATYATHDHFPIKAQWEQARATFLDESKRDTHEQWEARQFLFPLCQFAGIEIENDQPPLFTAEVREKLLGALYQTPSRYAGVMITDLFGLTDRVNVPGVMEGSNWAWRLEPTVTELSRNPHWTSMTEASRKLLIESGRAAE